MSDHDTTLWPLIGTRFGSRKQLVVFSGSPDRDSRGTRLYNVICDVCSRDSELFPDYFKCTSQIITNGSEPCGCFKKMRWSEDQYKIKIQRACSAKSVKFLGTVGEWSGIKTRLSIKCADCGMPWKSMTVRRLLNFNGSCRSCKSREKGNRRPDDESIAKFRLSGAFDGEYKFWRGPPKRLFGDHNLDWYYTCPACSADEYVLAGVCDGVFKSRHGNLTTGQHSCRCSKSFRWTKDQREYQISRRIKDEDLSYTFIGWRDKYENSLSRIVLHCEQHGNWEPTFKQFYDQRSGCPECAQSGFKEALPASFYVILAGNSETSFSFTGFGITNEIEVRLSTHRRKLKKEGFSIYDLEVFEVETGKIAKELERIVLDSFPCVPQKVDGFKREATYSYYFDDIVNMVDRRLYGSE